MMTARKQTSLKIIISAFLLFFFICTGLLIFSVNYDYPFCNMNNEWNIANGQTFIKNVKLKEVNDYIQNRAKPGDTVTLSTRLPCIDVPLAAVMLQVRNQPYKAYIKSNFIISANMAYSHDNRYLRDENDYINMPSYYKNMSFRLVCPIRENHQYSRISSVMFGNAKDLSLAFVRNNIINIACGVFLVIFGILFFIVGTFFVARIPSFISLIYSSILILDMGMLLLSHSLILNMFMPAKISDAILVLSTFSMLPLQNALLNRIIRINRRTPFGILLLFTDIFSLLCIVLHFTGILYINITEIPYMIIFLLQFFYVLKRRIVKSQHRSTIIAKSDIMQLDSVLALDCFFAAIPAFFLLKLAGHSTLCELLIISGPMFYAGLTLYNNFSSLSDIYLNGIDFIELRNLASLDGLTKIYNRTMADKVIESLRSSNTDYCVIAFDLNDLKKVNDNFGHSRGDAYIKTFSNLLFEIFGDYGTCARTGGDEFVVLSDIINEDKAKLLITTLQTRMSTLGRDEDTFYSVAAGYAFLHEISENDPYTVYRKADTKMYQNKKRQKGEEPR